MCVAWNGPEIGDADDTLKKAPDLNFADNRLGVHFKTNNLFAEAGATVESVLNMKN